MEKTDRFTIENSNYQGYLWWSDSTEPQVVNGEFGIELMSGNPFMVEGFLFDEDNQVSISVKYIDGAYYCCKYHLPIQDAGICNDDQVEWLANFGDGKLFLKFDRIWRPVPDAENYGYEVLEASELIFKGFNVKEK